MSRRDKLLLQIKEEEILLNLGEIDLDTYMQRTMHLNNMLLNYPPSKYDKGIESDQT